MADLKDQKTIADYGIGLGTYKLNGKLCIDIVCSGLKMGYRLIDTAVLYKNHAEIGEGIKQSGIDRKLLFISSKIHDSTQKAQKKDKDAICNSVKQILKELHITYLDQLLLHSAVKNTYLASWKILEELKAKGFVINIGVSNFRVDELENILKHCVIKPYVNQIEVSPFCTRDRLVNFCKQNGITVQAFGSLTTGRRLNDPNLVLYAEMLNVKPAFLLLYWAIKKGYVIIPKSDNEVHLVENLNVNDNMITERDKIQLVMDELDKLNEHYYTIWKHADKE
jgi:diketogulonate reductase-like aldo/keto reductase